MKNLQVIANPFRVIFTIAVLSVLVFAAKAESLNDTNSGTNTTVESNTSQK